MPYIEREEIFKEWINYEKYIKRPSRHNGREKILFTLSYPLNIKKK